MAKPSFIELLSGDQIPILYEDRSIMALDKPTGWMLVPLSWQSTGRNLHAALLSSIAAGDYWATSRNLKFVKFVHRLDAETSGILLFAKSYGAHKSFSELFETRQMEKTYLAITETAPREKQWSCDLSIGPDPRQIGRMRIDPRGKEAQTVFRVLGESNGRYLIEAKPLTGRTHQIRLHLLSTLGPILGDPMYGSGKGGGRNPMALRAVVLGYKDPFTKKPVYIRAPREAFLQEWGMGKYQPVDMEKRISTESTKSVPQAQTPLPSAQAPVRPSKPNPRPPLRPTGATPARGNPPPPRRGPLSQPVRPGPRRGKK